MSSLEVVVGPSGRPELLARYVEFVAGRCRPNTVIATVSDPRGVLHSDRQGALGVAPADLFDFRGAARWCWAGCVVARWSDCGSRICSRRTGGCSSPMARAVLWEHVELPVDGAAQETASDALFVVLKGARAWSTVEHQRVGTDRGVVGQDTSRFVNRCIPHCRLCGRATKGNMSGRRGVGLRKDREVCCDE